MTDTLAPTTVDTPWFDSHENLFTLATWLRENNGWNFFKENALDMLERPWKWAPEWRLASGSVNFVVVTDHDEFTNASASCVWCDTLVGYVPDLDGADTPWVTTYRDSISGDLACSDCAGQAANFVEPDQRHSLIDLPAVTPEMRVHFKAFGHTELFPVLITHTVATELGNILVEEGTATWGARNTDPEMSHGSISVWTKDTHYAGISTSSIKASSYVRLAGAAVTL